MKKKVSFIKKGVEVGQMEEGVCPCCGSEDIEIEYESNDIDGDGTEACPFKCPKCGCGGNMIRALVFDCYEIEEEGTL
jgi:hypothetical protein